MSKCQFIKSWIGVCGEEECTKHAGLKCKGCGATATRDCDHTGIQFVCGVPLCDDCKHCPPIKDGSNWFGLGGEHKPSAQAEPEWALFYGTSKP